MDESLLHQREVDTQEDERNCEAISVPLDQSVEDRVESEITMKLFSECCCKLGPNKPPCYRQFPRECLIQAREESLELSHDGNDIALLGQLRALRPLDEKNETCVSSKGKIIYHFGGLCICHAAFLFIHAISHKRLENLIKHYSALVSQAIRIFRVRDN